jgi:hypothetical protein
MRRTDSIRYHPPTSRRREEEEEEEDVSVASYVR